LEKDVLSVEREKEKDLNYLQRRKKLSKITKKNRSGSSRRKDSNKTDTEKDNKRV
jgi:hypothetical protein